VTYDYSAVRHNLYSKYRRISYGLQYTANDRHEGKEVMFLSNGLIFPTDWRAKMPILMSNGSRKNAEVHGLIERRKPRPVQSR